jgi:RHS repeat-associated protein
MLVFRPSFGGDGGGSYTKHYFAGTQRVSSKIGTTTNLGKFLEEWQQQEQSSPSYPAITTQAQMDNAKNAANKVYTAFGITYATPAGNTSFTPIAAFTPPSGAGGLETEHYFFHPDHLGSSNYITNFVGEVSQHSEYFAFGETFIEEHKDSHNSPYKFNGKELDEESGLYYYGARYYDPRISIWASVDPLANFNPFMDSEFYIDGDHNGGVFNHFNHNSYGYCYQNPVRLIDPNGKQVDVVYFNTETDGIIINALDDIKNDPRVLTVGAHGFPGGFRVVDNNVKGDLVDGPRTFNQYMTRDSEKWKNRSNNKLAVVIYACSISRDRVQTKKNKYGNEVKVKDLNTRLQIISAGHPNEVFIGSETQVSFVDLWFADYVSGPTGYGLWRVYKAGKLIGEYSGSEPPSYDEKWFDNPEEIESKTRTHPSYGIDGNTNPKSNSIFTPEIKKEEKN